MNPEIPRDEIIMNCASFALQGLGIGRDIADLNESNNLREVVTTAFNIGEAMADEWKRRNG